MKKKIVFRTGYMGLGAIEQLAFDIIDYLKDDYDVVVAIENHKNNSLVEKFSDKVKFFYLKSEEFENKLDSIREKKKNFIYKILYNYYLKKEKKYVWIQLINILNRMGK